MEKETFDESGVEEEVDESKIETIKQIIQQNEAYMDRLLAMKTSTKTSEYEQMDFDKACRYAKAKAYNEISELFREK